MLNIPTQQYIFPLFAKFDAAAVGAGASFGNGKINVTGYRRVVGNWHLPAGANGPAAGFPVVRQSHNGIAFDLAVTVTQDFSQPDVQFPFDFELVGNYIQVLYTQGGVGDAFLRGWACCLPH